MGFLVSKSGLKNYFETKSVKYGLAFRIDRGFHRVENRRLLDEILVGNILPRKGRFLADYERENSPLFTAMYGANPELNQRLKPGTPVI